MPLQTVPDPLVLQCGSFNGQSCNQINSLLGTLETHEHGLTV